MIQQQKEINELRKQIKKNGEMRIIHKSIILIIIATLAACDKGDKIYTVDADLAKHFNYKIGTYWIYRDSITGNIDSFAVESNQVTNKKVISDPRDRRYYQQIDINIGDYHNNIRNDTFKWTVSLIEKKLNFDYHILGNKYDDGKGLSLTYPLSPLLPSIIVNGRTYFNAYFFSYNDTLYGDEYCVNNDAGFIKIKIIHPKDPSGVIWELLKYNIKI